jgi:hypothetical protein
VEGELPAAHELPAAVVDVGALLLLYININYIQINLVTSMIQNKSPRRRFFPHIFGW